MTDTIPPPSSLHSTAPHRLGGFDYHDPDHAYFLTLCARQGKPFATPDLAGEVVASLQWLRANRGLRVYAYCLMPDHLHLLIQLGNSRYQVGNIVGAFKTFTTRQSWGLGYQGTLWQARFYDRIVRRVEDGHRMVEYILANPVRKELVEEAGAYPWSGMPDVL